MEDERIIYVSHHELYLHPENARWADGAQVGDDDLDGLAASIQEHGVQQPLIVVRDPETGRLLVVDGNRRLLALRLLDGAAPAAPVIVRQLSRREQQLVMGLTALQRRALDPIAEAKLYRRLIDEEGETRNGLARTLGVSAARIAGRLRLLDLDAEIQALVAKGALFSDVHLADALAAIPDAEARVALARKLASQGVSLQPAIRACARLKARLEADGEEAALRGNGAHGPAVRLGLGDEVPDGVTRNLRAAARAVCQKCDQYERAGVTEPAWALAVHAADRTCAACGLKDVRGACRQCPLPVYLRSLMEEGGDAP